MARVYPFHATSLKYPWAQRAVYHDDDKCPDGQRIGILDRIPGTGSLGQCRECAKL